MGTGVAVSNWNFVFPEGRQVSGLLKMRSENYLHQYRNKHPICQFGEQ